MCAPLVPRHIRETHLPLLHVLLGKHHCGCCCQSANASVNVRTHDGRRSTPDARRSTHDARRACLFPVAATVLAPWAHTTALLALATCPPKQARLELIAWGGVGSCVDGRLHAHTKPPRPQLKLAPAVHTVAARGQVWRHKLERVRPRDPWPHVNMIPCTIHTTQASSYPCPSSKRPRLHWRTGDHYKIRGMGSRAGSRNAFDALLRDAWSGGESHEWHEQLPTGPS